MSRYTGPKEKLERRVGQKLFLKGERSMSPKSSLVRKPYPPGLHGTRRSRKKSEYGAQLTAKQKIKYTYKLVEKHLRNYIEAALSAKEESSALLVKELETRLDNIIYRLGLAPARDTAKQLVSHGHFSVNDKLVSFPSYQVKIGDVVKLRPSSAANKYFSNLSQGMKKYDPPAWLEFDKEKMIGKIKSMPTIDDAGLNPRDIQATIEFYSRKL